MQWHSLNTKQWSMQWYSLNTKQWSMQWIPISIKVIKYYRNITKYNRGTKEIILAFIDNDYACSQSISIHWLQETEMYMQINNTKTSVCIYALKPTQKTSLSKYV